MNTETTNDAPQTDHAETKYVFRWICECCNDTSDTWFTTDDDADAARDNHVEENDECFELWTVLQRWPRNEAEEYSWPNFQVAGDDQEE